MLKQPVVDITQDPALYAEIYGSPHRISGPNVPYIPTYHWVREPVDTRDIPYVPANIPILPASIDLRGYCSPIDDQGQISSCTGNAIAGAIDLIDQKTQNKSVRVSRLFIYYQERVFEGDITLDNGAYIRDGIKACYTIGAPQEATWPYDISKFATDPSSIAYADAAQRKLVGYTKCGDFNAVINALASGAPVVVGFDVYSSFESEEVTTTGIMPYPDVATEKLLGGHAVCLVGYDNYRQWFIARNSWGTNWGVEGYFYMPYQVIQNPSMSSDFWTISLVNNP